MKIFSFSLPLCLLLAASPVYALEVESESPNPSVVVVPKPPRISYPASQVLKLVDSRIDEDIIVAYIDNTLNSFNLGPEEIAYLKDKGVSSVLITAMIDHDTDLAERLRNPEMVEPPTGSTAELSNDSLAGAAPDLMDNPPEEVTPFYQSLAPYGSWVYLEGRGWAWQPTVASDNPDWTPYVDDGRWLYSTDGWYWDSSYAWGWAPFHYGRWWHGPSSGWCWFPDTVWGPSWVTWRHGGGFCGWAPLEPGFFPGRFGLGSRHFGFNFGFRFNSDAFAFVRFNNLFDHNLRGHCIPHSEVNHFFGKTVTANNFSQRGNVVANFGVPVNHVAHIAGRTIPIVSVNNTHFAQGTVGRTSVQHTPSGNTIVRTPVTTPHGTANPMFAQRVGPNQSVRTGAANPAFAGNFARSGSAIREPAGAAFGSSGHVAVSPSVRHGVGEGSRPVVIPWNGSAGRGRSSSAFAFSSPGGFSARSGGLPPGVNHAFPNSVPAWGATPHLPPALPSTPAWGSPPGTPSFNHGFSSPSHFQPSFRSPGFQGFSGSPGGFHSMPQGGFRGGMPGGFQGGPSGGFHGAPGGFQGGPGGFHSGGGGPHGFNGGGHGGGGGMAGGGGGGGGHR